MSFNPGNFDFQELQKFRDAWEFGQYQVPFNDYLDWVEDLRVNLPKCGRAKWVRK